MNLEEVVQERLQLLRSVTNLTETKCKGCEIHSSKAGNKSCEGCPTLSEFRKLGDKLTVNLNKMRILRGQPVPRKQIKNVKIVGGKMSKQLTTETYHRLKAQGLTDSAIRKQLGIESNKFYKFKKENGLIGAYGNAATKKEEDTPALREKEVSAHKVDNDRVSILEKELNDIKVHLKDAMSFIESLKTENASLNEQLWGNRLQSLYAKQAELENFIARKHGISIHDYLDEQQLSILVELAESANEWQGFKYWKLNKNVDREKLLEETVDVLHLILARGIALGWQIAAVKAMTNQSITGQYKALIQSVAIDKDAESKFTYEETFNLYVGLVEMLGFTWTEVEAAYLKKHQENIDRQNNDY
ncbi:dUTP diphosphatase [Lysinibacillus sp. FSL K6-1151]|uniref:dUTP diphosphatase n=1 Tax=Lysinibacillus sp. FSL K6-1151 TaxID=2921465 RepID=UPI00315A753B